MLNIEIVKIIIQQVPVPNLTIKVEQDTRNDVVFDVKTSGFKLTTVDECILNNLFI